MWCGFPEQELPLRPGPPHVAYTLAVARTVSGHAAMLAFTTSQPWPGTLPHGVLAFDAASALAMGQTRAFVLDLRRLAYLPVTHAWFPRLGAERYGLLGRAAKPVRARINTVLAELLQRRPELVTRAGPLWKG